MWVTLAASNFGTFSRWLLCTYPTTLISDTFPRYILTVISSTSDIFSGSSIFNFPWSPVSEPSRSISLLKKSSIAKCKLSGQHWLALLFQYLLNFFTLRCWRQVWSASLPMCIPIWSEIILNTCACARGYYGLCCRYCFQTSHLVYHSTHLIPR